MAVDTNKSRSRGKIDTSEKGRTGLIQLGGHVYDEILPELRGPRWAKTVREMIDQDPVVGSILFAIEMLVRQVDWYIEPAKVEPKEDPTDPNDPTKKLDPTKDKLDPNAKKPVLPIEEKKPKIFAFPPFKNILGKGKDKAPATPLNDPKLSVNGKSPFPPKPGEEEEEPVDPEVIKANEFKTFIEQALFEDMEISWGDLLSEILSFLPWGWSFFEEVYKFRDLDDLDAPAAKKSKFTDGKVGWRKFSIRAQDTLWAWNFKEDSNDIDSMVQHTNDGHEFTIPLSKALLFRSTSKKDSPEGKSILRTAYRSWYLKKKIENIEAIGIERDLAGLPIMYVPTEYLDPTNEDESVVSVRNQLNQMIRNIRQDSQAGAILPLEYDDNGNKTFILELLSTAGTRQFDTNTIVARHNRDIAMCVLADFVIMGHDTSAGSFALADNKTVMFARACGTWMNSICDQFNKVAIPRLMKLNGMDLKLAPKLCHGDIETIDLTELGGYIQKLALAGVPGLDALAQVNYFFSQAKIPQLTQEEYDKHMEKMEDKGGGFGNEDTGGLLPGDDGYQGPNAPIVTQTGNPSTNQKKKPVVQQGKFPARKPAVRINAGKGNFNGR